MTDCGCLSNARPLRREVPPIVPGRLALALARWRAECAPDEGDAMILFGVGLATLQRIERGEVEPEPDLAERIASAIGIASAPHSDAAAHGVASVSPAAATAGNEGRAAAFPPVGLAAPPVVAGGELGPALPIPAPAPALAKGDDGTFHVEMFLGRHVVLGLTIEEADELGSELKALAALTRDPALYDSQPRLARPSSEES